MPVGKLRAMDYGRLATTPHALGEQPIFVTSNGRQRRAPRWLGRGFAVALAAWIASVVAGGSGFSALPPLPAGLAMRPPTAHIAADLHRTVVKFDRHLERAQRSRA